jgi:hypothetical protein
MGDYQHPRTYIPPPPPSPSPAPPRARFLTSPKSDIKNTWLCFNEGHPHLKSPAHDGFSAGDPMHGLTMCNGKFVIEFRI